MKEFEIKLILEVKNHCCVYAKNSPEYSNRRSRENAWVDIALVLGRRVAECQKKWNSLRDCFRCNYREESNTPSGSASTAKPKWLHFEALKFLIPYIKVPEDDCGNYSEETAEFERDYVDALDEPTDEPNKTFGKRKTQRPLNQAKKKKDNDNELDRVLEAIEKTASSPTTSKKPMVSFFEGVAKQVEHFTAKKCIEFQQKILHILATDFGDDL